MDTNNNEEKSVNKFINWVKWAWKTDVGELVRFTLIALIIVIPIRFFIAQPFIVSGTSMFPTFHNKDYLIVDEISYKIGNPHRGDVVIFKYPKDTTKYFIKRIIGLPGETISIKAGKITIKNGDNKDGIVLDEPYVENHSEDSMGEKVIGNDEFFVLGDNRTASSDSRYWGVLPRKLMTGRALIRLFPFSDINVMPGKFNY